MSARKRISQEELAQNQAKLKLHDKQVLESAFKHRKLGLAVHWNQMFSKAPVESGWNDTPVKSLDQLESTHRHAFNVGFRAGKYSEVDGYYLVVLDIDIKHPDFADEAYAAASQIMGSKFEPTVLSGSGVGRHIYLLVPKELCPDKAAITLRQADVAVKDGKVVPLGTPGSKPAWTVELLSTGKNVVMPPSIHPDTMQQYRWANGEDMGVLQQIPETLLDMIYTVNGADWPEPEPIKFELLPVAKFYPELLPEVLREFVYDIAERTQCPVDFVAVVVIQMLCTIIGNACAIRPKQLDNWQEIANLWAAIVGRPGQLKTPAKSAGSEPLRWLEWEAQQAYEAEVALYERAKFDRESEIERLKKIKVRSAQEQEELASLTLDDYPEPILRRYRSSDATIEKQAMLLNDNPRGLLIDRDVLMGWLAAFQKSGHEADRAFYLEGWNGNGKFIVDRVGRGTTSVEHLTLLVFGSIQPAKLQRYLHEALYGLGNDGLLQRFQLFVYPDDNPVWRVVDREPNREALDVVTNLARKLAIGDFVALGAQLEENRPTPFFRFAPEAQDAFNAWYLALGQKVNAEEQSIVAEHLGKYRKLVPALALVFHLVDLVAGTVPAGSPVSLAALNRAIEWAAYLETHARRIYHMAIDIREDAVKSLAIKLSAGELQDGFTERDVYRNNWSNLNDPELVAAACGELELAGWIRKMPREKAPTGGRPAARYQINPAVVGRKV